MSRLNELINELCPNGVEFVKLSDVAPPTRGVRVIRSQLALDGQYPVYQNSMTPLGYYKESNCHANTAFVISAGAAGEIGYSTMNFWAADDCFYFVCPQNLKSRFLYYALMCQREYLLSRVRRASVPRLARSVIDGVKIPIPPLPVQSEIVRILDNFTELTTELTMELTAELTARKKQYEYYRDSLLTFREEVSMATLGEIATDMYRGVGIKRDEVTEDGTPCVRYGEIYTRYNIWFDTCYSKTYVGTKTFSHGDLLFAITGESVNEIAKSCVYIGNETCFAGGDIVVMKHNQNPKYLSYVLSTYDAQMQKSKGKIKSKVVHSSVPAIKAIKIPLPSLDEQQRIVDILDRFDTLCNDISQSLPAEIKARHQQYEYYRDKLLTFPKAKLEVVVRGKV